MANPPETRKFLAMDLRCCLQKYAAIVVATALFWGEAPWVGSAAIALDHPTTHAQVWPDLDNPDAQMIVFADMLLNMDLTADAIAIYEQRYTRFIEQGEPDSAALTLLSLGDHFALQGHLKDAIPYYQRVTTITDATLSAWLIRDAQDKIGTAHLALGDFDAARQSYEDRLALERSIESSWAETETLSKLGLVYQLQGHLDLALTTYQQVVQFYDRTEMNSYSAPEVLNRIATIHQQQGQVEPALAAYQKALKIARRDTSDPQAPHITNQVLSLENISALYQAQGQPDRARRYQEEAQAVLDRFGQPDAGGVPYPLELILASIGEFYLVGQESDRAQSYFDRAVEQARTSRNQDYAELYILNFIVLAYTKQSQFAAAIPYQKQLIPIFQAMDLWGSAAIMSQNLGNLYAEIDQTEPALAAYNDAVIWFQENQDYGESSVSIGHIFKQKARLYEQQNQWEPAESAYQTALQHYEASQTPLGQIVVLERLAHLSAQQGESQQAIAYQNQALTLRRSLDLPWASMP
ncbi:tetratricopeptide repeat protein [Spirulina major]|uniref:tetratricopeptide repeat protein n=2 Tax=Spirulinaceae TaxID=1890448 RepID=UPI00232CCCBE|nr:tetratricopeptide repeat protein [Spirulina major]